MALKSTRPYYLLDGKAYCATCKRHRLARITGTSYLTCPWCDVGRDVEVDDITISLIGRELLCGRCERSALVPTPAGDGLECPLCDTPPWEHPRVAVPTYQNMALPGMEQAGGAGDDEDGATRPARPRPIVRTCDRCHQQTWHRFEWRVNCWRAACTSCGALLPKSRVKATPANRKARG